MRRESRPYRVSRAVVSGPSCARFRSALPTYGSNVAEAPLKRPQSTTLPIAIKTTDRALLQAAAQQLGQPESTFVREVSVLAARALLESRTEAPTE